MEPLPASIHIAFDVKAFLAIVVAVVIPTLFFWWRLHNISKRVLDMHTKPDDHGFGTNMTNALLSQHMEDEKEMHAQSIETMNRLTHTIKELSYYVRWLGKHKEEEDIPPYVRNGDNTR